MNIDGHEVDFIERYISKEEAQAEYDYAVREGLIPKDDLPVSEYWTLGWKVTIGPHQYGDFVRLTEPAFDEVKPTLIEQAKAVITTVKTGKKTKVNDPGQA